MDELILNPIGFIKSTYSKKYEAPKQPNLEKVEYAEVVLNPHQNFETALHDIEGFSHIWLIYWFHKNKNWKPKVLPPRHTRDKKGVFSTRSPYRPNPIGLSVVKLIAVKGRKLIIADHDLLDGTPILDIKPYLAYSDSHSESTYGWIDDIEEHYREIKYDENSLRKLNWLEENQINFKYEIERRLSYDPFPHPYRRITKFETHYQMRYKEWCCNYLIYDDAVEIIDVYSGFSSTKIKENNASVHMEFKVQFS